MKLLKQDKPNIRSYYGDGYDVVDIDLSVIDHLGSYILQENFSDSPLHPGISQPDWDADYTNITKEFYEAQQKYIDILKPLVEKENYFDYWRTLRGPFDELIVSINKMDKGSKMDWHWDGFDGSVLQLMLYVNLEERTREDGGCLEVGVSYEPMINQDDPFPHWSPETGLNKVTGHVMSKCSYVPKNDKAIILNNDNPLFVHRVTECTTDKPRYSVLLQCGYKTLWDGNSLKNNGGQYKDPRTGTITKLNL